jgi:hypothetical protein
VDRSIGSDSLEGGGERALDALELAASRSSAVPADEKRVECLDFLPTGRE